MQMTEIHRLSSKRRCYLCGGTIAKGSGAVRYDEPRDRRGRKLYRHLKGQCRK